MKKNTYLSLFIFIFIVVIILNMDVTTKQGINFEVNTKTIPLYYKAVSFLYRHFSYQILIKEILPSKVNDKQKIEKVFKWVNEKIRRDIPPDYPIIDDHVLDIIIRGYGTGDQVTEVFVTLCNYAYIDAFYIYFSSKDKSDTLVLAVIKDKGNYFLFDVFNGVYFLNKDNEFASLTDIYQGNWDIVSSKGSNKKDRYLDIFDNITDIDYLEDSRAKLQLPIHRTVYEIKKLLKK